MSTGDKVRPDAAGCLNAVETQTLVKHQRKKKADYVNVIDKSIATAEQGTVFVEDLKAKRDPLEYGITGVDPGLVVIFNQEEFSSSHLEPREGSRKDVNELILTLDRLKYNIDKRFIFTDLRRKEVKENIEKICKMDLSERNRLICIFLTHGGPENTLYASDAPMKVEEIYKPFCECDHFKDKPKFFLFQACKATKISKPIDEIDSLNYHENRDIVSKNTITDAIPEDVLLLYSTIEGEVSFRHCENGSWFIQELCRNMTAYGRRDDVLSLIVRTTKCVAYSYCYQEKEDSAIVKQMPIFISTLRRKFYITSSKERSFLLEVNDRLQRMQAEIDQLKQRVADLTS